MHGLGNPAAVPRLIVPVHVVTLNAASLWSWAHIGDKIGETLQPSGADRDSPAAVVLKTGVRFIVATGFHALPDPVFSLVLGSHTVRPGRKISTQAAA